MTKGTILAAVDLLHKNADKRIVEGALLKAQNRNATLELVFVIPDQQQSYVQNYIPAEMKAKVEEDAKAELKAFSLEFDHGNTSVSTKVLRGGVYEKVLEYSDTIAADYIIIGASRPSLGNLFIGPNAARIARHANCSVVIVRPSRSN